MNIIPDLMTLHDSRRGLRSLLQVGVRVPEVESSELSVEGPAPCLDFVASTAKLDRYREVIEPAG